MTVLTQIACTFNASNLQADKPKKYGAFVLVMFMLQHHLPFMLYTQLAALLALLQSKYSFSMHRSVKVGMEIADAIDTVLLRKITANLMNKPFGLEMDASTAIGNIDMFAIVVSL